MKTTSILLIFTLIAGCSLVSEDAKHKRVQDINEIAAEINTPTIATTLLDSAQEAEKAGNLPKAEQYYSQLIERDPDNKKYRFMHAEILRKSGKCEKALIKYESLLVNDANNLDVLEGKGLCLLTASKNQQASDIFAKILAAEPNRWKSLNAAGLIFATDKKFSEAGQYFEAAAKASENEPAVLNNHGLTKALMGNFKDAISTLQDASARAKKAGTQKRSIDLNLALIYGISGNLDMAEKTARPHLTDPQLFNNMGVYAELAKDKELAKTYLNKAMKETPVYYERAWENLERVKSGK